MADVATPHSDGRVVDLTAPVGGVIAGHVYAIGLLTVVARVSRAAGEKFPASTDGVWNVQKPPTEEWAEGDSLALYPEAGVVSNGQAEGLPANYQTCGHAVAAAVDPSPQGLLRLAQLSS